MTMKSAKVGKRGAPPLEKYSPKRKAEFLLSTATTPQDYRRARKEVVKLGLDPDAIPHRRLQRRSS